jgi:hypothetical protein
MIKSRTEWAGHFACIRLMRNAYNILVAKPKEKRPLGKPRYRWEINIKVGLKN